MEEIKQRNSFIDLCKGILILLVIIGHILPGTLYDNPIRYVIYSFHMPAFFYISGYLINIEKIRCLTIKESCFKYINRILIPWIVAVHIYYFLLCGYQNDFSFFGYIKALVVPYYHLWFGIGYLFCIGLTIIFVKISKTVDCASRYIVIVGILLAVLYIARIVWGNTNALIKFVEHTIRPWNFFFFALGVYISKSNYNSLLTAIRKYWVFFLILFVLFLPIGYFWQDKAIEIIVRFVFVGILLVGINFDKHTIKNNLLSEIGKVTYPVYLWHIIGKVIAMNTKTELYYIISVGWIIILFIVLKSISKSNPIRKIIGS